MNRLLITGALLLIVPAAAPAQTKQIQADIDKALQEARVYQDIEIMRRLVQRRVFSFAASCSKCHSDPFAERVIQLDPSASMLGEVVGRGEGPNHAAANFALWSEVADGGNRLARLQSSEAIVIDGHYVKGHGVVLQAQLPPSLMMMGRPETAEGGKKTPPPANEWDQIRRQLWGGKVESVAAPREDPHATNIQDVLLQVLAESGKHFQSLAANEQLTLNVTFRPAAAASGTTRVLSDGLERQALSNWLIERGGPAPSTAGGSAAAAGGSTPNAGNISFRDYELLADFHIKQGRYQEAVKTLQKALEVNKDASRTSGLYRKLASAYLLLDAGQSNPQVFEKVAEFLKKAQEGGKAAAPSQRLALPTRLVITAPRTALQQASPGKLEEFRRQITVSWLRFDHPALEQRGEVQSDPEKTDTTGK
jgi:tetratricopeptide (TPR) repeat protein